MSPKEIDTKAKIMEIAHGLFAKKGYEAVSVRDISKEADVNISAISYHFENKLGLYKSIIVQTMSSLVMDLEKIAEDNPSINAIDYVGKMFDYFTRNESKLLSSFKFFMSMSEVLNDIEMDCKEDDKPPGAAIFEALVLKEIPDVDKDDLAWLSRSVIGLAFHKSIICCTKCISGQRKKDAITPKLLKDDLTRATKLMLDSIK